MGDVEMGDGPGLIGGGDRLSGIGAADVEIQHGNRHAHLRGGAGNLRDARGVVGHGRGIIGTGHHAAACTAAESHASRAPFGDGETFGGSAGNAARHQPEGKQGGSDKSGLMARGTTKSAHRITRYVHGNPRKWDDFARTVPGKAHHFRKREEKNSPKPASLRHRKSCMRYA